MMEAAYYHLPTPSDSERLRTYLHRQPVQTPQHYPQVSLELSAMCNSQVAQIFIARLFTDKLCAQDPVYVIACLKFLKFASRKDSQ